MINFNDLSWMNNAQPPVGQGASPQQPMWQGNQFQMPQMGAPNMNAPQGQNFMPLPPPKGTALYDQQQQQNTASSQQQSPLTIWDILRNTQQFGYPTPRKTGLLG